MHRALDRILRHMAVRCSCADEVSCLGWYHMNKIGICAAVLALINILCCCTGAKDIVLLKTSSYSGHCTIKYGNSILEADITAGETGEFIFSVTSPEDLAGLTLAWNGDGIHLKFSEAEWHGSSGDYPDTSAAAAIKNAFAAAGSAGVDPTVTDDGFVIQGGTDSGDYKFTFDKSGLPKELSIPALDLTASFAETAKE